MIATLTIFRTFNRRKATWLAGLFLILSVAAWAFAPSKTLHLVGDSTMANHPSADTPERGWGQVFHTFFTDDLKIVNHARNGRSTKRFIDEGLWAGVIEILNPGDYVFIQFGHNDSKKSDPARYAAPRGAYRDNLIRFIKDCRAHRANPVLITPVCRRKFSKSGEFIDGHGEYPGVVRELCEDFKVPLIDLHLRSMQWLTELGPEASDLMFMNAPPGVYKKYPKGKNDNTHFNTRGALEVSKLVIAEMESIKLPILNFSCEMVHDVQK